MSKPAKGLVGATLFRSSTLRLGSAGGNQEVSYLQLLENRLPHVLVS